MATIIWTLWLMACRGQGLRYACPRWDGADLVVQLGTDPACQSGIVVPRGDIISVVREGGRGEEIAGVEGVDSGEVLKALRLNAKRVSPMPTAGDELLVVTETESRKASFVVPQRP